MALVAGISFPVLAGASVIAIEMSRINTLRAQLQQAADSAAIGGARELRLGNSTESTVLAVAKNYVASAISPMAFNFSGEVEKDKASLTINLSAAVPTGLGHYAGLSPNVVGVTATARVYGGAPVCALALDTIGIASVFLEKSARMMAQGCAVYSNANHAQGLWAQDQALLEAGFICTAGGKSGGKGNFTPDPELDCPQLPDPLANRPAPVVGACDPSRTSLVISGASETLYPGVYCNGLTITKGSRVRLSPGVYIIKDGSMTVDGGSSIEGVNTGFYFTGNKAGFVFAKDSNVSLSAPKDGELAGLLFFQDRATPLLNFSKFVISSNNAAVLLGTIYLSRSRLFVDGDKPVAQNSAYTIVVTRYLTLSAGPTMVLNSNYSATDVPVPEGVGPLSNKIGLTR